MKAHSVLLIINLDLSILHTNGWQQGQRVAACPPVHGQVVFDISGRQFGTDSGRRY